MKKGEKFWLVMVLLSTMTVVQSLVTEDLNWAAAIVMTLCIIIFVGWEFK